ncbi:MAG: hypothetical protein J6P42_03860 [Oscillospiraceae bacterium]|nr:hypothetical protein [Oscillospiraceae bacterium]MBO7373688.1 hypothetical protein [Oscillospiraceae bacterium]MBP5743649.1 hypothetical protein [Oscillospiraceae bacterium]
MLGKLLKHEFRATGRIMLPLMGALLALALMANLSIRGLAGNLADIPALRILFILILVFFGMGIVAIGVMALVVMVSRFYRNLLKSEGYLMFTLPVSVHELIWSKLIVSLVWFFATGLFVFLIMSLTALNLAGTNLEMIFADFPSWSEILSKLEELGVRSALGNLVLWSAIAMILGAIVSCLHFYGAMALGHMFTKNKVMLSVVFFILISFAFNTMEMGYGLSGIAMDVQSVDMDTAREGIRFASRVFMHATIMEVVQAAVLYLATALGLKRGLNLE